MIRERVFISGMGVISPLGSGLAETRSALAAGRCALRPLDLFQTPGGSPHPVGQVGCALDDPFLPRTHQLARIAADQALAGCRQAPDLVVVGTTTGGMPTTEVLLKNNAADPEAFRWHSVGSVAEDIAARCGCRGPVLTVSTACSSGAVAIKIALEMLRAGKARSALAGGVDALCRLTYHGFNSLQLIDPQGARPLDRDRRGMSVAEAAAMLLLVAGDRGGAELELLGAALSCDAHHPAAPHPEGRGAYAAMILALADAGLPAAAIDYVNLHGTGTPDNDLAEARAVHRVFGALRPPVSSVKGACGHPLAAAGALEAVVAGICIGAQRVPGNVGTRLPDPALNLEPVLASRPVPVRAVLSNSFGFGGNNACVVIGAPAGPRPPAPAAAEPGPMGVTAAACVTGAGGLSQTLARLGAGESCQGVCGLEEISANLDARQVRRLRYLPRLALSLAAEVKTRSGAAGPPSAVFYGTGWGALSETHGFLKSLFDTGEKFPSPTDFVGSVHNAAAGQVAILLGATGANVTTSGGDCSFEQALLAACHLERGAGRSALVIGADEHQEPLTALFDPSARLSPVPSAGGAALLLASDPSAARVTVFPAFHALAQTHPDVVAALIQALGGPDRVKARFGLVLAGIPAAERGPGGAQLDAFLTRSGFGGPVSEYRRHIGEHASASAVAVALAAAFVQGGHASAALCGGRAARLETRGCLVLGFGKQVVATEVLPR
jgi:3-oxoacyl-[acyl-carrier-protein] synthase-1/3-oxoacyl-[acyl-carrier-protein] synthase II